MVAANSQVCKRYFSDHDRIAIIFDPDNESLLIVPTNDEVDDDIKRYSTSDDDGSVSPFKIDGLLRKHNINAPESNEAHRYYPQWDADREVLIVNFTDDTEIVTASST